MDGGNGWSTVGFSYILADVRSTSKGPHMQIIDDECVDTATAARILDLSPLTLEKWRRIGGRGPRWVRIGRLTKYRKSELQRFLVDAERHCTEVGSRA